MNRTAKLITSILICLFAGLVGSVFTMPAIPTWYAGLNKPSFSPPNWLFGPVWTTLYVLMGISFFLVWEKLKKNPKAKSALDIFVLQLVLNCLWSVIFFGLKAPLLALIEIILLWLVILITIINFFKISKTAGWLLVPYLAWVSFASFLNWTIWRLN